MAMALPVPPGAHEIALEFTPGRRAGLVISSMKSHAVTDGA